MPPVVSCLQEAKNGEVTCQHELGGQGPSGLSARRETESTDNPVLRKSCYQFGPQGEGW